MIRTKKQAIELSIELWAWLAETGKEKEEWPGWRRNGGTHTECPADCFLCGYSSYREGCSSCPYYTKHGLCYGESLPFCKWAYAKTKEDLKRYAQEFLDQLKELYGRKANKRN